MFTGIVQGLRPVVHVESMGSITQLTVEMNESTGQNIELGASIAINGCCLTVVQNRERTVKFEVVNASRQLTNLGELEKGAFVNVERALKFGDEIGGHVLSGHIACAVEVTAMSRKRGDVACSFLVPSQWRKYLIPKGFVALNGASLTLAEFDSQSGIGKVNLIPETLERTNLGQVDVGSRLNMEVDSTTQSIVDTVERVLAERDLG